jgi:CrcB protein
MLMSAAAWLGIALLGGVGSVMRLLVAAWLNRDRTTADWPLGTFVINLSGSFVLGILSGVGSDWQVPAVLGLGLIGSYTTFSTWMIETAGLAEAGRRDRAALYIAASLILGLATVWAGHLLGSTF